MSVLAERAGGTWFRTIKRSSDPRLRLLCFPHAGGAASFFRGWADSVPAGVEVIAVRYPGREDRLFDPMADSLEDMARSVADSCRSFLDTPLAMFGHSMGASVAYETALRLQEDFGTRLSALFVSARTPPGYEPHRPFTYTTDAELIEHVQSLGGTDKDALRDPDVLDLVLPSLRGDYRLVGEYRGAAGQRELRSPVIAYCGTEDTRVPRDAVADWSAVTSRGFSLRAFPGDHFYLLEHRRELLMDLFTHIGPLATPARQARREVVEVG
ncbi:thioesterase II family protein [Streptomyces boluensis]|uniref:Alpha/beta fold hydrolase n=1 Tax=Streptomyces boluensis TaxID=1775135 RepID=A0A964UMG5_9ACTN|nr:alpha/beta fold hydrolase [Streptomyces boluensis]NBE51944.1 alpha/beta fold hydrolase [Streptomyces boluensis]